MKSNKNENNRSHISNESQMTTFGYERRKGKGRSLEWTLPGDMVQMLVILDKSSFIYRH